MHPTDNQRLAGAIGQFHHQHIRVYGWRWPAVVPTPGSKSHYYALDEAQYVAQQLIPAGLDGYIMDPESEPNSPNNNWNSKNLKSLAHSFCATIRHAANEAGRTDFVFGVTSGCDYATSRKNMPWTEFVAASDALFPQTYLRWTNPSTGKIQNINGGSPDRSIAKGLASWLTVAGGKPIIPMAGEIDVIDVEEIPAYAAKVQAQQLDFYHFYTDNTGLSAEKCDAIKKI